MRGRGEDFPDPDDFDEAFEAWHEQCDEMVWAPERTFGAVVLCHLGCALGRWLVVSGPQRGHVWFDDRADGGRMEPLLDADGKPLTFARWYLDWLEEAENRAPAVPADA